MAFLEDVFVLSGVPTYTFVKPAIYDRILVSMRTPGRCLVVEGPSGIGKTTLVKAVIEELNIEKDVLLLSARKKDDRELIEALPEMKNIGIAIIDDFHRLDDSVKEIIANYMKILADEGSEENKLVLIGINKAGDRLVEFGSDIGLRLDVFKVESNSKEKISELIRLGEQVLGVDIVRKNELSNNCHGSFQICQMLCNEVCQIEGVTETCKDKKVLDTEVAVVIESVMVTLRRLFHKPCIEFARGSRLRQEGRAPYLHILKWLSEGPDWSLDIREAIKRNPEHRLSVGQVIQKGFLESLLKEKDEILGEYFVYISEIQILSVEDPKIVFYLRNIVWRNFAKEAGFTGRFFRGAYDVALSFAGAQRDIASLLSKKLSDREIAVFYDFNEQHNIIATNVEEYLAPIYSSESEYVIPILSPDYPTRIWTKFESDNFSQRFGENSVIPIYLSSVKEGYFTAERKFGGLSIDLEKDLDPQIEDICNVISQKLSGVV